MYQIHVQNEHLINHNTKMLFLHFFFTQMPLYRENTKKNVQKK